MGTPGPRVCIVGGGIMGITTAYFLAKSGRCAHITILEEGDPAGGASGKAAGFLARDWHGPPTSSLGKLSFQLHEQLAHELGGVERYGYRKMPSLSMHIAEGAGTSGARRQIEAAGPVMNWMNADNIVDVDFIEDESGTAQVHPRHFCETLLAECIRLGVEVVQDRAGRVERVAAGSGGSNSNNSKPTVAVVCDGDHRVDFDKLVLCAGPWTGQVAKQLLSLNLAVHELPGHSFVMTTKEPLPALAGFASATGRDGSVTTTPEWFTRPDGTIYIAGENCAPLPPGTASVKTNEDSLERLAAVCRLISPRLDISDSDAVTHVHKALCYRPVSQRGYPYLCALTDDNTTFVAAGHGPWGISLGPGSGLVMSEMVLDGKATSANISYLGL